MRELKISEKKSLEAALLIATSEETAREVGRATFNEVIINGGSVKEALFATLDQVAQDGATWNEANEAFNEELEIQKFTVNLTALETALETLTDDESVKHAARVAFSEDIRNGVEVETALASVLDDVAEDADSWVGAEQAFYNQVEVLETENVEEAPSSRHKIIKVAVIAAGVIVLAMLAFAIGNAWMDSRKVAQVEPPVTTSAPVVPTAAPTRDAAIIKAMKIMTDAGWKPGEFIIDTIDEGTDESTSGSGAFSAENIKSPSTMVAFLKSGTDAANALLAKLMNDTGTTREEVLNDFNWVAVQSNIPFTYPGNTGFKKGEIINVGSRTGGSGDIFLLYVAPNGESQVVRGACANPQTVVPKPDTPTIPDTPVKKLTPKSPNKADYVHPIEKPVVPIVTTPPEVTPPVVDQSVTGPSGIVDSPTQDPGTESGVTAPAATPAVPDRAEDVPPAEPKVNPGPSNDGVNDTDPGNPF